MELYVTLFCIFQVSCKCVINFHNLKNKKERERKEMDFFVPTPLKCPVLVI